MSGGKRGMWRGLGVSAGLVVLIVGCQPQRSTVAPSPAPGPVAKVEPTEVITKGDLERIQRALHREFGGRAEVIGSGPNKMLVFRGVEHDERRATAASNRLKEDIWSLVASKGGQPHEFVSTGHVLQFAYHHHHIHGNVKVEKRRTDGRHYDLEVQVSERHER